MLDRFEKLANASEGSTLGCSLHVMLNAWLEPQQQPGRRTTTMAITCCCYSLSSLSQEDGTALTKEIGDGRILSRDKVRFENNALVAAAPPAAREVRIRGPLLLLGYAAYIVVALPVLCEGES